MFPHVHFQYVCNIPAKFYKDTPNTLGVDNFTTLCTISHYLICAVAKNFLEERIFSQRGAIDFKRSAYEIRKLL